jgi:hypothetical protein
MPPSLRFSACSCKKGYCAPASFLESRHSDEGTPRNQTIDAGHLRFSNSMGLPTIADNDPQAELHGIAI